MKITSNLPELILILPFFCSLQGLHLNAAEKIVFSGLELPAVQVIPNNKSGIHQIFVVNSINEDVKLIYNNNSPEEIIVEKFGTNGLINVENVNDIVRNNDEYFISNLTPNCGYIITQGNTQLIFWIVDYSYYLFYPKSLEYNNNNYKCESTIFNFIGDAQPIYYYGINGSKFTLDRDILLTYPCYHWNEKKKEFSIEEKRTSLPYINGDITISPAISAEGIIRIEGDKFLKEWNQQKEIYLNFDTPDGIEIITNVESMSDDNNCSNEIINNDDTYGGNAPCQIILNAFTTPNTIHTVWEIASDDAFSNILYRFYEKNIDYIFNEQGDYYVRFIGSNDDGSCEKISETITIHISDSRLLVPNTFSPNNDGINDIWKVSYQSILTFKCWIFDRHGHLIHHFENPAEGWDGKINGKVVRSGIFYYIINAEGSDGKKYNLSGDINILSSTNRISQ